MIRFLSVEEVIAIQQLAVDRFGGNSGVRDVAMIESAVFRPQSGYYETNIDCAAALMESLLINYAFVDDNKRIAFFATDTFLSLNGYRLNVEAIAAEAFIKSAIDDHEKRFERIKMWIKHSLVLHES